MKIYKTNGIGRTVYVCDTIAERDAKIKELEKDGYHLELNVSDDELSIKTYADKTIITFRYLGGLKYCPGPGHGDGYCYDF